MTRSPFLVHHARDLYYAHGYESERQSVDFLAFREFLESIRVPAGKETTHRDFRGWLQRQPKVREGLAHPLFEEFKGVLTGARPRTRPYLAREDYLRAGGAPLHLPRRGPCRGLRSVRDVPRVSRRASGLYDSNIVAHATCRRRARATTSSSSTRSRT